MYLQVEPLLVALILDGQVDGHIDQLEQLLLLNKEPGSAKKYDALDRTLTLTRTPPLTLPHPYPHLNPHPHPHQV